MLAAKAAPDLLLALFDFLQPLKPRKAATKATVVTVIINFLPTFIVGSFRVNPNLQLP